MAYDLVFLTLEDKLVLLLKHDELFEKILAFYENCNVIKTDLRISMSEYIFITSTIGSHIVCFGPIEKLIKDCKCIVDFYQVQSRYTKKYMNEKDFELCKIDSCCTHLIYNSLLKKSFLSAYGKQICQFYNDFSYIDAIPNRLAEHANMFFQNKIWMDKQNLNFKWIAFKNLFD